MKAYIAGPITGIPNHNKQNFTLAENMLVDMGYEVINPHNLTEELIEYLGYFPSWKECMLWDLEHLAQCDLLVLLPLWEKSKGAMIESLFARKLKIRIVKIHLFNCN